MICPSCGRENPAGTAYCSRCGRWLAAGRALGVTYQQSPERAGRGGIPGGLAIGAVLLAVVLLVGAALAVLFSSRPPGPVRPTQFAVIPTVPAPSSEIIVQPTATLSLLSPSPTAEPFP